MAEDLASEPMHVRIWRGDGDGGAFQSYEVPRQENQTVLDVVAWVQQQADPSLSYRFACRVGMCGSCAMMVNGIPRWTCRTHVSRVTKSSELEVAPLRNLPVIKDLATDMDPFFDKWTDAGGYHSGTRTRDDDMALIDQEVRVDGIECINCAICYAACDTVSADPDYLGPAALQRAWTVYNDEKTADSQAVLSGVTGSGGCHSCHSMGSCAVHCPNDLNPMQAIAGLKRESMRSFFGRGK